MHYSSRQRHRHIALAGGVVATFLVPRGLDILPELHWLTRLDLMFAVFTLLVFVFALYAGDDDVSGIWIPLIPAVMTFTVIYFTRDFIPTVFNDGHTLLDIIGYVPPFDLIGQFRETLPLFFFALTSATLGIGLKRAFRHEQLIGRSSRRDQIH